MDELTRFARHLAGRLGDRSASVAEIRSTLVPYQTERRALEFASIEDYETVLLRLIAEEQGHLRTSPPAAAERCREELAQPNPDLGVLDHLGDAIVQLGSPAGAPPAPEPAPLSHPAAPAPSAASRPKPPGCPHCGRGLPAARAATFCPWCGERVIPLSCSRCGTELEPGWRHCITCGTAVRDPFAPAP